MCFESVLRAEGERPAIFVLGEFETLWSAFVPTFLPHDPAGNARLLTIDDVAAILGRSPSTIRKDLLRRPGAVPPRVRLPGTRQLRWRAVDVQNWLASHSEGAK